MCVLYFELKFEDILYQSRTRKLFETRSRPDLSQTSKSCIMELNRTSTISRVQYVHKSLSKALHGLKITSWLSITSHGHIQTRKTHCLTTVQNCTGRIISRPVTDVVGSTVFKIIPWWRHQMGTFSALLALCEGNPPVTAGFPSQRPVTRNFYVFFDLCLNKRLSKQSRRRWFETPSHALWRRCNATEILYPQINMKLVLYFTYWYKHGQLRVLDNGYFCSHSDVTHRGLMVYICVYKLVYH